MDFYESKLTGKKKLVKDDYVLKKVVDDHRFSKTFEIGNHSCTVLQIGEKYELTIDNQLFSHILELERNKTNFINAKPVSNVVRVCTNVVRMISLLCLISKLSLPRKGSYHLLLENLQLLGNIVIKI